MKLESSLFRWCGPGLLLLTACEVVPEKVAVEPDRVVLDSKDDTQQLKVVAHDSQGNVIDKVETTWHSMDERVCAIDFKGIVHPLKSGICTVRAKVGKLRADAHVRVAFVSSIEVEPSFIHMGLGVTRRFSAKIMDDQGKAILGKGVVWASSNEEIATIDPGGNVKTVGSGEVRIVARTEGAEGAAQLVVE